MSLPRSTHRVSRAHHFTNSLNESCTDAVSWARNVSTSTLWSITLSSTTARSVAGYVSP